MPWTQVRHSRLWVIDAAAHSAHYEKFEAYAGLVSNFLGEHGL